jgi:hypothetical protein
VTVVVMIVVMFGRRVGRVWNFIRQRQQRVALRAGETTALFAREKHDEGGGEKQAEKEGYRDGGHGVGLSA